MKWKAKNSKIVYVSPYGVVTPLKKGSTKIYGYTKDGTNKKVTINVTVKAAPVTATPTPNLEKDPRTATTVEDFESYAEGTTWKNYTAGGYANSGTMTVVKDPENPNNKVLKVDYTGTDQAYDYAPVFNLTLPNGKKLSDFSAIRLKSRVIANTSDCNYKTIGVFFDGYGTIKSSDYFYTSNYDGTDPKKAPKREDRFGCNLSMATGVDVNYNVPTELTAGLAIQDKDIIAISPNKKYNNKVFPTYYQDYASGEDKTAISPGYSETETNENNKVGFQQNTLELNQDMINAAWISDTDTTPLLDRNKLDMVLGSTYIGSQGRSADAWHLTLYLDDIQVMSGTIECTSMSYVNPPSKIACGTDSMAAGSAQLSVSYEPKNTTQKELVWTSSDTSLATVDSLGIVTANNNGKTGYVTITASNKANGNVKATATIYIENVTPATEDYNVLDGSAKIVAEGEASATNKVVSNASKGTIQNGVMQLQYNAKNVSYVIDLGKEVNLNRYKGVEIAGVCPGQLSMEFYSSSLDMNVKKDDGYANDWWDGVMSAGHTYPFFQGSCSWRYEAGGTNTLKAWENGYKGLDANDKTDISASPETLRYSLDNMASGCNGDWSAIRYIILKTNGDPLRPGFGEFDASSVKENRTEFTYTITGLKFLASEFVEARSAGFYNLDLSANLAEEDGNAKSYYIDNLSTSKPADKRDQSMNISDMKYIRVDTNAASVKVGLIAEGKVLADAYLIGEETGSGERALYFSLKDIAASDIDLKAIDAISVETSDGTAVTSIGMTKGEISYSKNITKYEVSGTTVKEVTLAEYGTEE